MDEDRAGLVRHLWVALEAFADAWVELFGAIPAAFAPGDDSPRDVPTTMRKVLWFASRSGQGRAWLAELEALLTRDAAQHGPRAPSPPAPPLTS